MNLLYLPIGVYLCHKWSTLMKSRANIENSKQLEEDTSNQKFRIKLNQDVTKYKITADNA